MPDHSSGSAIYSEDQKRRVIAFLDDHRGPDAWTTTEEIQERCEIKERALRALFSDLDGTLVDGWAIVLAYNEAHTRLWLASSPDEARATTRRLRHQALAMNLRADRREHAYSKLGAAQGALL